MSVPLGPRVPEWLALREALHATATSSGGDLACVLDTSGSLWCTSETIDLETQRWAMDTVRLATHELHARLGRRVWHASHEAYGRRFAGNYVLLVRLVGDVDELRLHRAVDAALSEIERLTTALPPTDGPETAASVATIRR